MEVASPTRRLAAIVCMDVAGYSRLMGADEEGTLARVKAIQREVIDPALAAHRGRLVKTTGDGFLAEFASVVDAVRCAASIQRQVNDRAGAEPEGRRIALRIGVNLGDVIAEGGDLHGDGVNVAARLQALAEPGAICLSGAAYEQVRDRVDLVFIDAGEEALKNIARPVRVWRLRLGAGGPQSAGAPLLIPDKPSIAVLPFANLSGDPEQEYFADGMVEEIIAALSRMRWLFVIARNSSFTYKGRAVDVKQVGRELGVRYVLEGSVRKAGNRVRIAGELIDTSTGANLWADRFEGGFEDVFDLQDQVTTSVIGAIAPKLEQAEIERAERKPTESLDAYDFFLRGMGYFHQWTRKASGEALQLFYRAIELDADFAAAYGMAARTYAQRKGSGWVDDRAAETAEAARLARRAVELGKDDAAPLCYGGWALANVVGDLNSGAAFIDRALILNPNLTAGWLASGWVRISLGEPDVAIEHLARAMRLSPFDPLIGRMQAATGTAHLLAGRYEDASSWAEKALQDHPSYLPGLRAAAASAALAGRLGEALKLSERLLELDPTLRISNLQDRIPIRRPEDFIRFAEGLRKAGVPE
jgi:adenylate cyclase